MASERDEAARTAWRAAVAARDPEQLVFVDESSTHIALTRLCGWAPHDQRARGVAPRNHGHNITLVAALTPAGLQVPWLIEGAMETTTMETTTMETTTMETTTFEWYVAEQLGPTLRPGQVVVLDKWSSTT